MSDPVRQTRQKMESAMNRKEEFLRAVQQRNPRRTNNPRLAFGWALNLKNKSIPADVKSAARHFAAQVGR